MVRRRASAPSALMLLPASVPLVRGQPKFILPSPPSEYATIHLADHKKLSDNCYNFKNLEPIKELPRLKDLQISDHIKIQNLQIISTHDLTLQFLSPSYSITLPLRHCHFSHLQYIALYTYASKDKTVGSASLKFILSLHIYIYVFYMFELTRMLQFWNVCAYRQNAVFDRHEGIFNCIIGKKSSYQPLDPDAHFLARSDVLTLP